VKYERAGSVEMNSPPKEKACAVTFGNISLMKTKVIVGFLIVTLFAITSGCVSGASGSAIVTGTKRVRVSPTAVKLYLTPPKKYEVVGLVEATGKAGRTDQAKMDRAVNELKEKAGEIGANGVLIGSSGDASGGVVGAVSNGVFFASRVRHKQASGQAIFVIEE
jgi:hypothetical protein